MTETWELRHCVPGVPLGWSETPTGSYGTYNEAYRAALDESRHRDGGYMVVLAPDGRVSFTEPCYLITAQPETVL